MTGRMLVAGIGNVLLGDDAFGVEVATRLQQEPLREGVRVMETGIRARHLAYEILDGGYDTAILVDACARGGAPGTISLTEPKAPDETGNGSTASLDAPAMNLEAVLAFLQAFGGVPTRILIVGCEPGCVDEGAGLSAPVAAAVDDALALVRELLRKPIDDEREPGSDLRRMR
jgi:hydrogenase maturation protease